MTEHDGKNKTSPNKNKKEINLTQEFIRSGQGNFASPAKQDVFPFM